MPTSPRLLGNILGNERITKLTVSLCNLFLCLEIEGGNEGQEKRRPTGDDVLESTCSKTAELQH